MARRRMRKNAGLPPYVYRYPRGYVYREYLGVQGGKTRWGKDVYLAPPEATEAQVNRAYYNLMDARAATNTLSWLLDAYHDSPQYRDVAPRTRRDYESYQRKLKEFKTRSGQLGDAPLAGITKRTIRGYLDRYPAPVAANRHIQYLKAAWNWAEQRYSIPSNPCVGVDLNKEKPRERYVTQDEMRGAAACTAVPYLPILMELAYLCRARRGEVTALRRTDVLQEGLFLKRSKGSRSEITAWTPRLRAAVDAALDLHPGAPGNYLLHTRRGDPIPKNAIDSAWQRMMKKWVAAGGERFTLQDLKAAGYSDQKVQDAGHKGPMHDVYNRKPQVVEPAE